MVAPQVRLELTTLRLTAECSAIELLRIIRGPFAARLPAGGSLFCFQLALALSLATASARTSLSARSALATASASLLARLPLAVPFFLMFESGKNFRSSAPCGSRQLPTLPSRSQLSTISVWRLNFCVRYGYRWCPPAIVTGNFPQGSFSLAPLPAPSKLRNSLTRKHSLFQIFRLFPSRSPRPPLFQLPPLPSPSP